MTSDQRSREETVILADVGGTRTEARIRRTPDGPHVSLIHRISRPGRASETRPFTIGPDQIAASAELLARLGDEHTGGTLAVYLDDVRRALAGFHTAGSGDSNDQEIAAAALADAVEELLAQRITRASLGAVTVRCGCGDVIEQHGGAWFHKYNPAVIGHDDKQIRLAEL